MGYCHEMNAEFICHPGVSIEQLADAIGPLAEYFAWSREDLLQGAIPYGDNGFEIVQDKDGNACSLSLSSAGQVGDSYIDIVKQVAANLNKLVEPSVIGLKDLDTPQLESATDYIWVGEGEALIEARKAHTCERALDVLREEYSAEQVKMIQTFIGELPSEADQPAIERPRG